VKNKKLFAILTLVCFMFTLMPVAAFAGANDLDNKNSILYLDENQTNVLSDKSKKVSYKLALRQVNGLKGDLAVGDVQLYVWAEEDGSVSPAMDIVSYGTASTTGSAIKNVISFEKIDDETVLEFQFARAGVYTICAGFGDAGEDSLKDIQRFSNAPVVTVLGTAVDPDTYDMDLVAGPNIGANAKYDAYVSKLEPNNVAQQYTLAFTAGTDELANKAVSFVSDSANLKVVAASDKTDPLGRIKIYLSAAREGVYSVYATVDGVKFVIGVNCTHTDAAYINTVAQPVKPIALFTSATDFNGDLLDKVNPKVLFNVTDINGNSVTVTPLDNAFKSTFGAHNQAAVQYLAFTEKPAASTLTNESLYLANWGNSGNYALQLKGMLDAEGTYAVKVILDNGAIATAKWEVKKFETPVAITITAPATVELGKSVTVNVAYVDKNGTTKSADDVRVAATGYAIDPTTDMSKAVPTILVKSQEQYAGSVIKLTAVSELYDLVATKEIKVAKEAVGIEFAKSELEVNVNNKVKWDVVDEAGNKVSLTSEATNFEVKYVVLDKPEGAQVSVYDKTTGFDGDGEMAITCNKVGVVKVQVVAQIQQGNVTKYYTGVQEFAVGMDNFKDVVVMSIGSKQIVINSDVKEMLCEAVIKDGRTMVPFRAGLEALGATVDYDKATQSVIAEMNGVKVVMTIGENVYTVNGVAKVADVAPYLNVAASTTMVPASFVANAFGINVDYTTNPDGTVADVLFAN